MSSGEWTCSKWPNSKVFWHLCKYRTWKWKLAICHMPRHLLCVIPNCPLLSPSYQPTTPFLGFLIFIDWWWYLSPSPYYRLMGFTDTKSPKMSEICKLQQTNTLLRCLQRVLRTPYYWIRTMRGAVRRWLVGWLVHRCILLLFQPLLSFSYFVTDSFSLLCFSRSSLFN